MRDLGVVGVGVVILTTAAGAGVVAHRESREGTAVMSGGNGGAGADARAGVDVISLPELELHYRRVISRYWVDAKDRANRSRSTVDWHRAWNVAKTIKAACDVQIEWDPKIAEVVLDDRDIANWERDAWTIIRSVRDCFEENRGQNRGR